MINPFSTPMRKDSSLQAVKQRVCRRLSGAHIVHKPSSAIDNQTLCSSVDSDCSTLVGYDDDGDTVSRTEITEGDFLPFEDQSWTRHKLPEQTTLSRFCVAGLQHHRNKFTRLHQDELLDEEECSWVMPRSTRKAQYTRPRFSLFTKRPTCNRARAGIEPQLLEPEERSWV